MDEGKPYNESDEAFTQISLSAFKLGTFLKISEELLNDAAFNVEQYLASEFARRIGAAEEEAFFSESNLDRLQTVFEAHKRLIYLVKCCTFIRSYVNAYYRSD
ncbi:phage major capsid protein [Actinotignum urinale]